MTEIKSLADLRPGDIMFGPIGGAVGVGVGLGQLALGEAFRVGRLSIRHVGIVVEASRTLPPGSFYKDMIYTTGVITAPRMIQAMPSGAEEIEMRQNTHWTPRHAYARMTEDYPGQAEDAAAIARLMVAEGVAYSFASYAALAAWHWGFMTPKLEAWIDRRRPYVGPPMGTLPSGSAMQGSGKLPVEAICSVLVDQAWSLAGKRVAYGAAHQAVTPGMLADQLWRRSSVTWGGAGFE